MRYVETIPENSSIFFLTPCHWSPFYSHLHRRIRLGFLDCSPRTSNVLLPPNWMERAWDDTGGRTVVSTLNAIFRASPLVDKDETSDAFLQVSPGADKTLSSFFGDAKKHQSAEQKLDRPFSEAVAECIRYRFVIPLRGDLPTHFVFTSSLLREVEPWLRSLGYVPAIAPIFDSVSVDTPRGRLRWNYAHVWKRVKKPSVKELLKRGT